MDSFALIAVLFVGVVVLTPLSARVGIPQPVVLTSFGLGLGVLPFVPEPRLDPDLILGESLRSWLTRHTRRGLVDAFEVSPPEKD